MIACFLSNISAKYYKNPSMLSRVIAKNVGDVFFETRCILEEFDSKDDSKARSAGRPYKRSLLYFLSLFIF